MSREDAKMERNIIWHNHHIVPRHAGGTDDPENIIRVNVKMHAFLHYQRFLQTGDIEDKIASWMLAGQKTPHEARLLAARIGRERRSPYGRGHDAVRTPKRFTLYSPTGQRFDGENLQEFCKQNRLQTWLIDKLLKGKRRAHKGWTACPDAKPQGQGYHKKAYPLLSPDGQLCIIYSLSALAKENGLSQGNLGMVIKGTRNHTKGWRDGRDALDQYQEETLRWSAS